MILNNIDNLIQITEYKVIDNIKGFFTNGATKAALKEAENKLNVATTELQRIRNRDKNIGKAFTATTGLGLAGTGGYLYGRKENQERQYQQPQPQPQPTQQNTIPPMDDRKKLAIGAGLVGAADAGSLLMNRRKRDDN